MADGYTSKHSFLLALRSQNTFKGRLRRTLRALRKGNLWAIFAIWRRDYMTLIKANPAVPEGCALIIDNHKRPPIKFNHEPEPEAARRTYELWSGSFEQPRD